MHPDRNHKVNQRSSRWGMIIGSAVIAILFAAGCDSPTSNVPETYPVMGVVKDAKGTPLEGGSIEFLAKQNQELLAVSSIGKDGSFQLSTYLNGDSAEGAVAGEHLVTVYTQGAEHGDSATVKLAESMTVAESENELDIELPRLPRQRSRR